MQYHQNDYCSLLGGQWWRSPIGKETFIPFWREAFTAWRGLIHWWILLLHVCMDQCHRIRSRKEARISWPPLSSNPPPSWTWTVSPTLFPPHSAHPIAASFCPLLLHLILPHYVLPLPLTDLPRWVQGDLPACICSSSAFFWCSSCAHLCTTGFCDYYKTVSPGGTLMECLFCHRIGLHLF